MVACGQARWSARFPACHAVTHAVTIQIRGARLAAPRSAVRSLQALARFPGVRGGSLGLGLGLDLGLGGSGGGCGCGSGGPSVQLDPSDGLERTWLS